MFLSRCPLHRKRELTKAPKLYELTERATATHKKWIDQQLADIAAAEAKAKEDRTAIEKQLSQERAKIPGADRPLGELV